MAGNPDTRPRSLGPREAEVVSWLELERPRLVDIAMVTEALDWPDTIAGETLRRLHRKGWLQRALRGKYEPLLADSGGWALPNAWAALSSWDSPYYVSFGSAAYELNLNPDRPSGVQAAVPLGIKRPRSWGDVRVTLVHGRAFSLEGSERREIHGHEVQIATVERTTLDGALVPARVGGALGLVRIADRAHDIADWSRFVGLAKGTPRGHSAARRVAALYGVLDKRVPEPLAEFAGKNVPATPLPLDSPRIHGDDGPRLEPWNVILNVSAEALTLEAST